MVRWLQRNDSASDTGVATCTSQSHPMPAATHRLAKRSSNHANKGTNAWKAAGKQMRSTSLALTMAPQR